MKIDKKDFHKVYEYLKDKIHTYSSFTHVEGVSHLSPYWRDIETSYSIDDHDEWLLRVREIQENRGDEPYFRYSLNLDGFEKGGQDE